MQFNGVQLLTDRDVDQHDCLDGVARVNAGQEGVRVGVGHCRCTCVRLVLATGDEPFDLKSVKGLRLGAVVGDGDVDRAELALGLGRKGPARGCHPALDRMDHECEGTILDGLTYLACDCSRRALPSVDVLDRGIHCGNRRHVHHDGDGERGYCQNDRRDGETFSSTPAARLDEADDSEDQAQDGEEVAPDVDDWDEGTQSAQKGKDEASDSQTVRSFDLNWSPNSLGAGVN